jgi:tRNA threonylcarbamoyladenosine biosynthesis protein TsaB
MSPDELASLVTAKTVFTGEGAKVYRDLLAGRLGDMAVFAPAIYGYPTGTAVALRGHEEIEAGRASDPSTLLPLYIRKSDVEERAGY